MMLYLGDPDAPLDFRECFWGHNIHGSMMYDAKRLPLNPEDYPWWKKVRFGGPSWLERMEQRLDENDKALNRRRYSVPVHSSRTPRPGLKMIWRSETGDMIGTIYDYECMGNPRDMFKVWVVLEGTGLLEDAA